MNIREGVKKIYNKECPICFIRVGKVNRYVNKCGHVLHGDCFLEMLKTHAKCPTCRYKNKKIEEIRDIITSSELYDYINYNEYLKKELEEEKEKKEELREKNLKMQIHMAVCKEEVIGYICKKNNKKRKLRSETKQRGLYIEAISKNMRISKNELEKELINIDTDMCKIMNMICE
jgi:hypothetical protein